MPREPSPSAGTGRHRDPEDQPRQDQPLLVGEVRSLFHYPVKGLAAQPLVEATLEPGRGFPFDRMFGLVRAGSGFDPSAPKPMPKDRFLMLMKDERLAGLGSHFDPRTSRLTLKVQGRLVHEADLSEEIGRRETDAFFARMFDLGEEDSPRFVSADPHRFTDVSVVSVDLMNAVSLINLDSVADLAARIDLDVDPARFRANVYFDGWPASSELDLVGRTIRIGAASARVSLRTRRCAATEVNPRSARRDLPVPRLLKREYGHADCGVYAEILEGGTIRCGDRISWEAP